MRNSLHTKSGSRIFYKWIRLNDFEKLLLRWAIWIYLISFATQSSSFQVDIEASTCELNEDEMKQHADTPFWQKLRKIIHIAFLVAWIAVLVSAICIVVLTPKCPHRPDQKWYDRETVYEILPESFRDSNAKAVTKYPKEGDGVGDLKGNNQRT